MTSHEWATKLKAMAEEVLARPEFPLPRHMNEEFGQLELSINYFSNKEQFLEAVRACGSGVKDMSKGGYFNYKPSFGVLVLTVNRDSVCKLVKPATPAEYDCEPLLSREEVEAL